MSSPPKPVRTTPLRSALDTRSRIETPEGIDLILRPAGLVPRSLAFAIDLAVRAAVMAGLILVFGFLDSFGLGLAALAWFILDWWYMVLFEVMGQGRTPGKRLLHLRVVHDDGTPIGWASSLSRNLLRFVDMLPLGYSIGALSCLSHPEFKRFGDLVAGTLVIHDELPITRPSLPEADAAVASVALRLEEQRAILGLAERQAELSKERGHELAEIIAGPLHLRADEALAHLNGMARALLEPT